MLDPTRLGPIERALYDKTSQNHSERLSSTGVIVYFDETTWQASIEVKDPVTGDMHVQDYVPIPKSSEGLIGTVPSPGDYVLVSFVGGSFHTPYVTAVYPRVDVLPFNESSHGTEVNDILTIL